MNRTIIAPLLGFIFVGLQLFFHIDIDEATKASISAWIGDGVALALILYGIWKNHQKDKKKVDK
jgi:hypothetical protein